MATIAHHLYSPIPSELRAQVDKLWFDSGGVRLRPCAASVIFGKQQFLVIQEIIRIICLIFLWVMRVFSKYRNMQFIIVTLCSATLSSAADERKIINDNNLKKWISINQSGIEFCLKNRDSMNEKTTKKISQINFDLSNYYVEQKEYKNAYQISRMFLSCSKATVEDYSRAAYHAYYSGLNNSDKAYLERALLHKQEAFTKHLRLYKTVGENRKISTVGRWYEYHEFIANIHAALCQKDGFDESKIAAIVNLDALILQNEHSSDRGSETKIQNLDNDLSDLKIKREEISLRNYSDECKDN